MIKQRLPIKIIILFLLSFPLHVQAQKHPRADKRPTTIDDIKKAVVFLGEVTGKGKPDFHATGFLVNIHKVYHLVTAKHVVVDKNSGKIDDNRMHVFFNSEDGNINRRSIQEIKNQGKINGFLSEVLPFLPFIRSYQRGYWLNNKFSKHNERLQQSSLITVMNHALFIL